MPNPLLTELLSTIAAIPSEEHRRRALRGAAPLFDADARPAAFDLARALADPFCRAQSLTALAARTPPDDPQRPPALLEALDAIRQTPDAERRAVVLLQLAALADDDPNLDPLDIAREALESIAATPPDEMHARWLAALPPDLDSEAAAHIAALPAAWLQALAWAELAANRPALDEAIGLAEPPAFVPGPEALLRAAIAYQQIEPLPERLMVAPALFALLPDEDRDSLARELTLEATSALPLAETADHAGNGGDPARPLVPGAVAVDSLAAFSLLDGALGFLPGDLLPHALALARAVDEPSHRMDALARLAARLPQADRLALADEALAFLTALGPSQASPGYDEFGAAAGLSGLARFFPPERFNELTALAERLTDGWARAEALSALARAAGLGSHHRPALLQAALAAARANPSPWKRARALSIVISRM